MNKTWLFSLAVAVAVASGCGRGSGSTSRPILPTQSVPSSLTPVTRPPTPTFTPRPSPTATFVATSRIATIFMESDPMRIRSAFGGVVTVRAFAFDEDNLAVNGVNVLFDITPKVGRLRPITAVTDTTVDGPGVATTTVTIEPDAGFIGVITVTASTGDTEGRLTVEVTP